jgi:hypothetical protein
MKWLILKFWRFWYFVRKIIWKKPAPLFAKFVNDLPDVLGQKYVYLTGENGYLWEAAFKCPCGCDATIQLNLLPEVNPCWQAEEHIDGTISLSPSVWSKKGCGSHYFMRRGFITWCREN